MYLVTGVAGFIGYHTALALLEHGLPVLGVDNLKSRSCPLLRQHRLERLLAAAGQFTFLQADITSEAFTQVMTPYASRITHGIHLAAIANARHSFEEPRAYIDANIAGQAAVLELCRQMPALKRLVYASSSSVYGGAGSLPFREDDRTDQPFSVYGASKKAAEIITETYANAFGIAATGLRFFSVYGPWSRPDMACSSFTAKILRGESIQLFNGETMHRDFTYIDDIVAGILAAANADSREAPFHKLYNLGSGQRRSLLELVEGLEDALGVKAIRQEVPLPRGEMTGTWADISKAALDLNYQPQTDFKTGLKHFVRWYREFHRG